MDKKTLVVNVFGGAGSGKTTACWNIASELKKRGYSVELAPEYAKDLVWDGKIEFLAEGSISNQKIIFEEQKRRIDRLIGKVDIVMNDCPLPLMAVYVKESGFLKEEFTDTVFQEYNSYDNFNFVVRRDMNNFETVGRIHSLEESVQKDNEILNLLNNRNVSYSTYTHSNLNSSILDILYKFNAINGIENTLVEKEIAKIKLENKLNYINVNNLDIDYEKVLKVLDEEIEKENKTDILDLYRKIKDEFGEDKLQDITDFLKEKPEFILNDVYYNKNVRKEFDEWSKKMSNKNFERKAIGLDIETTGVDIDDEILQLSIVDEDMNILFDSYFKPVRHTTWNEAQKVNNITPNMVKDAKTLEESKDEILAILEGAESIVGYNHVNFDIPFLERELQWMNTKPLHDVMYMYADYMVGDNPYNSYKFYKLVDLMDKFDFKHSGYANGKSAHDACYDVLATMYGYNKLKEVRIAKEDNYSNYLKKPLNEVLGNVINDNSMKKRYEKGIEISKDESIANNYKMIPGEDGTTFYYNNKYEQIISFDSENNVNDVSCSCPDCVGGTKFCKHIIGTLLITKEKMNKPNKIVEKHPTLNNDKVLELE